MLMLSVSSLQNKVLLNLVLDISALEIELDLMLDAILSFAGDSVYVSDLTSSTFCMNSLVGTSSQYDLLPVDAYNISVYGDNYCILLTGLMLFHQDNYCDIIYCCITVYSNINVSSSDFKYKMISYILSMVTLKVLGQSHDCTNASKGILRNKSKSMPWIECRFIGYYVRCSIP